MRRKKRVKTNILYRVENRDSGIVSYLPESTINTLSSSTAEISKYNIDYETEYVYNQKTSDYQLYTEKRKTHISSEVVESAKTAIKNKLTE